MCRPIPASSSGGVWPSAKTTASPRSCSPCPSRRRAATGGLKNVSCRRARWSAVATDITRRTSATLGRVKWLTTASPASSASLACPSNSARTKNSSISADGGGSASAPSVVRGETGAQAGVGAGTAAVGASSVIRPPGFRCGGGRGVPRRVTAGARRAVRRGASPAPFAARPTAPPGPRCGGCAGSGGCTRRAPRR